MQPDSDYCRFPNFSIGFSARTHTEGPRGRRTPLARRGGAASTWRMEAAATGRGKTASRKKKPQELSPCLSLQNENMLFSRPLFGVRKLTQNPLTPRCNKQFQSGLHFWVRFCSKRWRHVVVVFTKKTHFWWEKWPQNGGHILDPILGPRVMKMKGGPQNGAAQWTPKWGHGRHCAASF